MRKSVLITMLLATIFLLSSCATTETSDTWKMGYVLDDFGDQTDEVCVVGRFSGTFSNSATTDSDLEVEVIYNCSSTRGGDSYFTIHLLEYCKKMPTFYSDDNPTLKVKIGDEIYEESLEYNTLGSDLWLVNRESFRSECYSPVFETLSDNTSDIRCVITAWKSTYEFTLEGSGFSSALLEAEDHELSAKTNQG